MNNRPIIIIDDDKDDLDIIKDALCELAIENEIIVFDDGPKFIDFIRATENAVFLILCDVNMPNINGLELKRIIYDDEILRLKCVPFIFLSTGRASKQIMNAYSYGVQGYFVKPSTFDEIKGMLQFIITYWKYSEVPNV